MQAGQQEVEGGGGGGYDLQQKHTKLGVWSTGWEEWYGFESSFELGFFCSIAHSVEKFIPYDREKCLALGTLSFVKEIK